MGLIEDASLKDTVILVDTNVIVEAIRTSTWKALTGSLRIETVEECRDETGRGDKNDPDYVEVTADDLARVHRIHQVTPMERAALLLADPESSGLDAGERDLFAHALSRAKAGDNVWFISSPDKASIRAAFRGNIHDQLVSLEVACKKIGARPGEPFKKNHLDEFLREYRTGCVLGLYK